MNQQLIDELFKRGRYRIGTRCFPGFVVVGTKGFQVAFDCHVLIGVEKEGRFRNICKSFIDKSCLADAEVAGDDDHAAAFAATPIKCILQILNLGCSLVKRVFLIQNFSPVRRLASVFSPEAQSLICNVAFFAFKINSVQMFEDDLDTSYI